MNMLFFAGWMKISLLPLQKYLKSEEPADTDIAVSSSHFPCICLLYRTRQWP